MKSYSLSGNVESSPWLDVTMAPPAANSESVWAAIPIPGDDGYKWESMDEATRHDFLLHPTKITKRDIVWKETSLPENEGLYATILDNVLTAQECESLIRQAEITTGGQWEQAMINVGGGMQQLMTDARDCGRIIWDSREMVARIWDRVKDFVPEIHFLMGVPRITGNGPAKRKEVLEMSRCNERMRFLKYGEGQYSRRKSPQDQKLCLLALTYTSPHGRLLLNSRRDGEIILHAAPVSERGCERRRNLFPFMEHETPTRR